MKQFFLLGMSLVVTQSALAQSTTFIYQGRLNWNGQPANGLYDFGFSVTDAEIGGTIFNGTVLTNGVGVTNGLFTVSIDPGVGVFTGPPRWLDIVVRTNGDSIYTPLSPRQFITSTPYAMRAGDAATAASVATGAVGLSALQAGAVDSERIADGTVTLADLGGPLATNTFWRLHGNGGTSPGANFIGTMDNQPLDLRVNNTRALRLEPNATSPNVVGGYSGNIVSNGNAGAVIAGGGFGPTNMNRVAGSYSTVGGGYNNEARLGSATVAGGDNNFAGNDRATVGGGFKNRATALLSTVAGGDSNEASGAGATVPGGRLNVAGGNFSLAAGQNAKATNAGAFVWADGSGGTFNSTSNNQFLIRAEGGVGIGLNNPVAALDVNGRIKATEFQLGTSATPGSILTANASGVGSWQAASFVSKAGDTLTGDLSIANPFDLNFGNSTRQMINLWDAKYGLGVQNNTLYQRSDGGFAWFQKGVHDDNADSPGTGGTPLMRLDATGNLYANASVTVDEPNANAGSPFPGFVFGFPSGEAIASARAAGSPNQYGIDFYANFTPRLSIANNGNVGINTTSPGGWLDINTGAGSIQFRSESDLVPSINIANAPFPGTLRLRNSLEIWPDDNGVRAGYLDVRDTNGGVTIRLDGDGGEATVKVLNITGGADIAEPFQISDRTEVPKGAVVAIDEDRPGHLKLSERAYDTRVAGIVSGANGVNPGITLHQEGLLDGSRHVALSGRVYALAVASNGPIKPGDLLTSSGTPGHLMRVTDHDRAQGAVVGKAMSVLSDGTGMVLVLVSLQ